MNLLLLYTWHPFQSNLQRKLLGGKTAWAHSLSHTVVFKGGIETEKSSEDVNPSIKRHRHISEQYARIYLKGNDGLFLWKQQADFLAVRCVHKRSKTQKK